MRYLLTMTCSSSYSIVASGLRVCLLGMSILWAQGGVSVFREAEALRKQKQYEAAVAKYDEAIRLEPTKDIYYIRKGQSLSALKKNAEAIQAYQKALELNPGRTAVYKLIASSYIKEKRYDEAINALNMAYEKETAADKKISYKVLVSKLYLVENRPSEAINAITSVKSAIPAAAQDPRVLYAEGEAMLASGNAQAAISSFQAALDKVKDMPIAKSGKYYYGLALAHYKAGDATKANEVARPLAGTPWERKLKAIQTRSGARFNLAIAQGYYKIGAYDEALEYVQEALKTKEMPSTVYKFQGAVLYKKGRNAEAINSMLQAAQNEPDDKKRSKIYSTTLKMQFNSGDYTGAVSTADRILEKSASDAAVMQLKAQALYQLGRYGEVVQLSEAALRSVGNEPAKQGILLFLQGVAARKSGDVNKAREALTQAKKSPGAIRFAAGVELDKLTAR